MSSFTREQYVEVFKNAREIYMTVQRGDLSGPHRHKMRTKALATFIMDQCEEVIGQMDRPDRERSKNVVEIVSSSVQSTSIAHALAKAVARKQR
jgi:hypothetical protein